MESPVKKISLQEIQITDEDLKIENRTSRGELFGFSEDVNISDLVNQIFADSVKYRASDIHIEHFEKFLAVRLRIDGTFYEYKNFDTQYSHLILTRVQVLAGLKIDQTRIPQDGKINLGEIDGKRVDLRVSTLPTIYGNKICVRVLEKDTKIKKLADLGYNHNSIKKINKNLNRTYGMILMSGPTGSGKTTTLFAMLSKYDPFKKNISTLEDPVEYFLEGVNQCQVNPEVGFDFPDGLRSLVRQDPDIIMLGEIRDSITSKLAIQAAITGHLVFSTVHANTASSTIQRLTNMGADPFLVSSALNLVISQRLVKKNCEKCLETYQPSEKSLNSIKNVLEKIKEKDQIQFIRGRGCENCNNSGFHGRIGIYEILEVDENIKKVIIEKNGIAKEIEKEAIKNGMITIKENGIINALQGKTTIEEILIAVDEG